MAKRQAKKRMYRVPVMLNASILVKARGPIAARHIVELMLVGQTFDISGDYLDHGRKLYCEPTFSLSHVDPVGIEPVEE